MPVTRLVVPYLEAGDTLDSGNQNSFLGAAAVMSSDISDYNLRQEAINYEHLDLTDHPIITFTDYMQYSGAGYTFSSDTPATVDATGSAPCEITGINTVLHTGDVVRIYANVLSGAVDRPAPGPNDEYLFQFRSTVTAGSTNFGPRFVYSMSGCNTDNNTGNHDIDDIEHQRHMMGYTYIHNGATTTLDTIALRVVLADGANSLFIFKYNLLVQIWKH